jgi:DNA-binding response OmpR family regulator
VVDDERRTAAFISDQLTAAGHECVMVGSGETALQAVWTFQADLIVLDVMLPGGTSGFEVCRRLRRDPQLYTLPILLISAMSGEEEVQHGLAQGADDYITKPFDVQNLIQRVDALIRANANVDVIDEMTGLPGGRAAKREMQRRVSSRQVFHLASAEMVNLREFSRLVGVEGRNKAIRHLGRALKLCGEDLPHGNFMVGHMGGGYFICMLEPDDAASYCDRVLRTWREHLPTLYETVDLGRAYQQALAGPATDPDRVPILDLLVCLTSPPERDILNLQDYFDVLSQIRNNALATNTPGIHFNRRG